jgi:hypothetical protein
MRGVATHRHYPIFSKIFAMPDTPHKAWCSNSPWWFLLWTNPTWDPPAAARRQAGRKGGDPRRQCWEDVGRIWDKNRPIVRKRWRIFWWIWDRNLDPRSQKMALSSLFEMKTGTNWNQLEPWALRWNVFGVPGPVNVNKKQWKDPPCLMGKFLWAIFNSFF